MGMQLASGLSLSLVAIRCFLISAAHGVNGRPPGILAPISKKVASGGDFGSGGNGGIDSSPQLKNAIDQMTKMFNIGVTGCVLIAQVPAIDKRNFVIE